MRGGALGRIQVIVLAAALGGCAQLPTRPEGPHDVAIPPAEGGPLDARIGAAEARHPGQSGFRLVKEGTEAFVVRMQSARHAARSLDVQSYIWHADLTGAYLGAQLLGSADRGVRVRLLLDDLDARAKNDGFAALAAHPNIEVRMFNPWATRRGAIGYAGESALSFERINRRMHNKSWIADNRLAVVGGRNVGDEYFGASDEMNFVDLDFAMVGPVVRDVSATFDRYWNSPSAYPMETLDPAQVNETALARLRKRLAERSNGGAGRRYAEALRGEDVVRRMLAGDWPMQWTSNYSFVADDPRKVTMSKRDPERTRVGLALLPMLSEATREMTVISPYFVPGEDVTAAMTAAVAAGRRVRVLTNSLVANDVAAVHGGYSRYRKPLLRGGVEIWELKPLADGAPESSMFGSSGASLHTKAFSVDGRKLFVGSYNLDPRSTWLNCEQGVLVEDTTLAAELEALFAAHAEGRYAWRVTPEDDGLAWSDGVDTYDRDPLASGWRRFQAWITRVLRLDAQL
jgi:putative cardiolipin synthase